MIAFHVRALLSRRVRHTFSRIVARAQPWAAMAINTFQPCMQPSKADFDLPECNHPTTIRATGSHMYHPAVAFRWSRSYGCLPMPCASVTTFAHICGRTRLFPEGGLPVKAPPAVPPQMLQLQDQVQQQQQGQQQVAAKAPPAGFPPQMLQQQQQQPQQWRQTLMPPPKAAAAP